MQCVCVREHVNFNYSYYHFFLSMPLFSLLLLRHTDNMKLQQKNSIFKSQISLCTVTVDLIWRQMHSIFPNIIVIAFMI